MGSTGALMTQFAVRPGHLEWLLLVEYRGWVLMIELRGWVDWNENDGTTGMKRVGIQRSACCQRADWSVAQFSRLLRLTSVLVPLVASTASLEFDDIVVREGDEGRRSIVLPLRLASALDQAEAASISYTTFPESASSVDDYTSASGRLVFLPGARIPGLPRPGDSDDPLIRVLDLESEYGIDVLAELDRPLGLAVAPEGSAFGEALYAGSLGQNGSGVNDYIVRVDYHGQVEDFARLESEADPTSLEFPPAGSQYGDFLFVSANNRDGQRPGDQGGTIQRLDAEGEVIDFSAIGIPLGPGEPGELAFGLGTAFGDTLFVANSVGSPGDILSLGLAGELSVVASDGLFEGNEQGLAPRSIAIAEPGRYGGLMYFGEFGRGCSCLKVVGSDGRIEPWVDTLPGDPHAIKFAPAGVFNGDMFVAVDDGASGSILRVEPSGSFSVFLGGLQGFFHGNGKDVIEFSRDGSIMFVADYFAGTIYRVAPASELVVEILGDIQPEPDETIRVEFSDPINLRLPNKPLIVTIENDDRGDRPPEVSVGPEITFSEDSGGGVWRMAVVDDRSPLSSMDLRVAVEDQDLITVESIGIDPAGGGYLVILDSVQDGFGTTEIRIELEDEGGNIVRRTQSVVVTAVNDSPTLGPIGDVQVSTTLSSVAIPLNGIGSGADNETDVLSISVDVEGALEGLRAEVFYRSPETLGSLRVDLPELRDSGGEVEIEVIVSDGGREFNEARRRFRLSYEGMLSDAPPSVVIVSPESYQILPPSIDGVLDADPIRIVIEAFDDRGVERVELFANDRRIGVLNGGVSEFQWREEQAGDYELLAVAYDAMGQFSESLPVYLALSSVRGRVAVVRNHDGEEIDKTSQYLFEMGFVPDVFWFDELDPPILSSYDLVVWYRSPLESWLWTEAQATEVRDRFDSGIPFYLIGGGSGAEIPGLNPITMADSTGDVIARVSEDAPRGIVHGNYGSIAGAMVMLPSEWAVGEGELGVPVVDASGVVMMRVAPDPAEFDSGQTRQASQSFPICVGADSEHNRVLQRLFQNTVCWLLRCPSCHAVDLELSREREGEAQTSGDRFRYEALVRHSGECEGIGVRVRVPIPEGVLLGNLSSSRGIGVRRSSELVFELGRMMGAAEAQLSWEFDYQEAGRYLIEATLLSSSEEVNEGNNHLVWETVVDSPRPEREPFALALRKSESGDLEIGLVGASSVAVEIEQSEDLIRWFPWRRLSVGEWGSTTDISFEYQRFFRIRP